MKKHVQAGGNRWRKVTARMKVEVQGTVARSVMETDMEEKARRRDKGVKVLFGRSKNG